MRLFDWFSRKSASSLTTLDLLKLLAGVKTTKSGQSVGHDSALSQATVFACARVYALGLATVPFKLMQEQGRDRNPARDHELYELISLRPNEWQTSFEFRQMVGLHLALANQAFVYKVIDVTGKRILELLPFPPSEVEVKRRPDGSRAYRIRVNSDAGFVDVPAENIWHIKYLSWNGVVGLDTVDKVRESIGLALSAEEHGARFYANGAQVNGLLSTDASLGPEKAKELRESWEASYSGSENSGKTAVLWGGLKYQPIAMQADHSQYDQTRMTQDLAICRGFGVMPIMAGIADKTATYASAEAMFQAHVTFTLMPLFQCVEQSAAVALLSSAERRSGYYVHLNANGLMRGSVKDRGEYYWKRFQMGSLSPNDIRGLEDENPYEGGDEYFVQVNMVPVDMAGKVAASGAKPPADPPEPAQ